MEEILIIDPFLDFFLYKNKYYTKKQKDNIFKYYIWKYYKSEIKNSKNFIIDLVDVEDQLGLKKYLSINNIKNVLLYTNLDNLIRNGLLSQITHGKTIRLCPPLTITKNHINKSLEIIKKSVNKRKNGKIVIS